MASYASDQLYDDDCYDDRVYVNLNLDVEDDEEDEAPAAEVR